MCVAQFFYVSGQTLLGLEPASSSVLFARHLADASLLRKALTFHGILQADAGNLPLAIEAYAEALDLSRSTGDARGEAFVWNNLGVALIYGAQYTDAIQCLDMTIRLSSGFKDLEGARRQAQSNIALASLHIEDFARGLSAAEASVDGSPVPTSANELLSRVLCESNYARLLLEVDSLEAARRRCEIAKDYASRAVSQRAEQSAAIAEGLYEVFAGKTDIGLSRLQGALDRARIMKATLRDALIALVKAYELAGKPQLALVHLRELLHHTRKTQQERALLHHRLHLQQLGGATDDAIAARSEVASVLDRSQIRAQLALLHRQAVAAELVEDPTGEHVYRVGKLAALLGAEIGLDDDTCFMLEMSARLHDIGKIGIPDAIMAQRGPISPEQKTLVRSHANIGAELLSQSGLPHIQMAVDIARHHHERWDADGYPDGIAGRAIPEAARITALADAFDVLTHDRPYRKAGTVAAALAEIERGKGSKFDPEIADRLIELVRRLQREVGDLDEYLGQEARESPFIQARRKIAAALAQARGSLGRPATR